MEEQLFLPLRQQKASIFHAKTLQKESILFVWAPYMQRESSVINSKDFPKLDGLRWKGDVGWFPLLKQGSREGLS